MTAKLTTRLRAAAASAAAVAAIALAGAPVHAHQQSRAISTIAPNARSNRLEIMHQIPLHDAEHGLQIMGTPSPDILGSEESRLAFADHVAERFVLEVDGAPVTLAFVGTQIEGGSLWIYQEADLPRAGAAITVNSQILTDAWPAQENRVNLGAGTRVKTLVFRRGDGAQRASL